MIPLVVLDLDGTLIGASGRVEACILEAADAAREAGVRLAICTGRPGFGIAAKVARRVDPDTPHIFQNGAQITYLDGDTLQVSALKEDQVRALVKAARELGLVLELYTPDTLYVERKTEISEAHATMIGVTALKRDLLDVAANEPVVRAQWVVPPDRYDEAMAVVVDGVHAHPATSPALPGTFFVSLTRGAIDKGSAVRKLTAKLEIDPAHVMAIGDSPGDVAMLEAVGHPRVVASGDPDVVARWASHVLPGVEACGAADGLRAAITLRADAADPGPHDADDPPARDGDGNAAGPGAGR